MNGYLKYWGKALPPGGSALPYHSFACHSLDVVAVGSRWLKASRALARHFLDKPNPEVAEAWTLFFLGLHDLGKLDLRFQAKAPHAAVQLAPERAALMALLPPDFARYAHGPAGFAWALEELPLYAGVDGDDEERVEQLVDAWQPWLAAVTGHHGTLPRATQRNNAVRLPLEVRKADQVARTVWARTLEDLLLVPAGISMRDHPPPLPALMAGFCSVADWLGSNTNYFRYAEHPEDLKGYLHARFGDADELLSASGLVARPLSQGGMSALFPEHLPRQVQTLVDALPRGPGLTLVEAPTGSGKTEAALAYAAHLLAAGLADSIVFALPTQATANAMLRRVEAVAPRLFPGTDANVVLAHGKSRYQSDFIAIQQSIRPVTAQAAEEASVQCAKWLSQSRKRAFLGQIGICTIDQVLLSALPVRHNFVRTLGVGRSALIVDEVHAYDSYMYGLLEEVLRRQRQAGGSAILLSATLPYVQRQRLVNAWTAGATLTHDAPYPLLTHVDTADQITHLKPTPAHQPQPRSVAIEGGCTAVALPGSNLCQRAVLAARSGACVAIICNLVDHAQQISRRLREMAHDVPVDLFHARYRFCDRQQREREVVEAYGPSRQANRGRILVATQVVEQSLDLDFDWLVTQLCPIDLLFQRLGRLHRHERPRPTGFETPRFCVLFPEESDFGPHASVYGNLRVLWRTRRLLEFAQKIEFPSAYRAWIERVYEEGDWPDEPDEVVAAADAWWSKQTSARQYALQLALGDVTVYADEDSRIQLLTRDGEMSLTVLPMEGEDRLLDGRRLSELADWQRAEVIDQQSLSVPASWKRFLPAPIDGIHRLPMQPRDGCWIVQLDRGQLVYSIDYGMQKASR